MTRPVVILRRLVHTALFCAASAGTVWGAVSLAHGLDAALTERTWQITRFERAAASLPQLRADLAAVEASGRDRAPMLLPGDTATGAVAAFQDHVKDTITKAAGRVDSVETLPAEREEPFDRFGLRVTATLDHAALRSVLHGLESGRPSVVIERLQIRPQAQRSSFRRAAQPDEAVTLQVMMTLSAFHTPQTGETDGGMT